MTALSTRCIRVLVVPLFPIAVLACSGERATEEESPKPLIGGTFVTGAEAGATLRIGGTCTAAKVGPRLVLTAAHCLFDQNGPKPTFAAGKKIGIEPGNGTPAREVTVRRIHVHPTWVQACATDNCTAVGSSNVFASDVGLVETVEEIADVPTALVDADPVGPGVEVTLAGNGCENGVGVTPSWLSGVLRRLKMEDAFVLPVEATLHTGSYVAPDQLSRLAGYKLITPGPAYATAKSGLCPGDSGGPLYRAKTGALVIVGINASYTFSARATGLPVTNWHTRLDDQSADRVASWLAERGVSLCHGSNCPGAPSSSVPVVVAENAGLDAEGRDGACQDALRDAAAMNAAVAEALAIGVDCQIFDGRRIPTSPPDYAYAGGALCRLATPPAPDRVAGFAAAMQVRGFSGFQLLSGNNYAKGVARTSPCSTQKTREERCASAPNDVALLQMALSGELHTPASCSAYDIRRIDIPDGDDHRFGGGIRCELAGAPDSTNVLTLNQKMASYASSGYLSRVNYVGNYQLRESAGHSYVSATVATFGCNGY